jgi:hypothetical protein
MVKDFLDKERRKFISFVERRDNLFKGEGYRLASDWEKNLTSGYWKNWREKKFRHKEDLDFFHKKVLKLRSYILWVIRYYRGDKYDASHIRALVEIKERELENANQENFKEKGRVVVADAGIKVKELSAKEMLNDPWFSKEIDNLFGLENGKPVKKDDSSNNDYKSWTKDQLISEINRLKAEIEQLKNNQTLTSSERQERLQRNQQNLKRLESVIGVVDSSNTQQPTSNSSLTPLLVFISILSLASLGIYGIIKVKKTKKIKK